MESLMFNVLVHKFPDKFTTPVLVDIGSGWLAVAQDAVIALSELHSDIRVGAMFRDGQGMLAIDVGVAPPSGPRTVIDDLMDVVDFDTELVDKMMDVVAKARLVSAWTCYDDGKPAWLVDAPEGRRPLCPECQAKRGMRVRRHAA